MIPSSLPKALHRHALWLASPRLFFALLPALMLLVVAGTLAQREVGLYVAEQTFFNSWFLWIGGYLPLPAGYTVLTLITLSLTCKFLLKSEWSLAKSGINLTHAGALLLLGGGMLIAQFSEDGFITIAEGESGAIVSDYHQRELLIAAGDRLAGRVAFADILPGASLSGENFPFHIEVLSVCRNCRIERRPDGATDNSQWQGAAQTLTIAPAELAKQDEVNVPGFTFRITGSKSGADGTYLLFEEGPTAQFSINGTDYTLHFGKARRELPFSVKLTDFSKTSYPGTETARAYRSDVVVKQGALEWPAVIEMNKPLRLLGYTLYQSSFAETADGRQATVLAVAYNRARWFPYLATGLMAVGLLLHLFILFRQRRSTKTTP